MTSLYGNIGGAQKSIASVFCNIDAAQKQIFPLRYHWKRYTVEMGEVYSLYQPCSYDTLSTTASETSLSLPYHILDHSGHTVYSYSASSITVNPNNGNFIFTNATYEGRTTYNNVIYVTEGNYFCIFVDEKPSSTTFEYDGNYIYRVTNGGATLYYYKSWGAYNMYLRPDRYNTLRLYTYATKTVDTYICGSYIDDIYSDYEYDYPTNDSWDGEYWYIYQGTI